MTNKCHMETDYIFKSEGKPYFELSINGYTLWKCTDDITLGLPFNYCPYCGRKLTDDMGGTYV